MLYAHCSIGANRVIDALEKAGAGAGLPKAIIVDNGPEFAGRALDARAHRRGIQFDFIRPGKPTENGFIERLPLAVSASLRLNGRLRDERLNTEVFFTLEEAREKLEQWRQDDNTLRPHSSLGYRTPCEYAASCKTPLRPTASAPFYSPYGETTSVANQQQDLTIPPRFEHFC